MSDGQAFSYGILMFFGFLFVLFVYGWIAECVNFLKAKWRNRNRVVEEPVVKVPNTKRLAVALFNAVEVQGYHATRESDLKFSWIDGHKVLNEIEIWDGYSQSGIWKRSKTDGEKVSTKGFFIRSESIDAIIEEILGETK